MTAPTAVSSRAVPKGSNRLSVAMFITAHVLGGVSLFFPLTRQLLLMALASYVIRMWAVSMGYHRYFSHRSFKTSRAFQFLMAWVGAAAVQNGPLWWASWHRLHHKHSDTPEDVHSPVQRGFWHAQAGWYYDGEHMKADFANVSDLAKYPELMFVESHGWLPPLTWIAGCYALAGWAGIAWGFMIPTLVVLHCVGLVNSLGHVWGSQRYDTGDGSRNNALLAVLTFGDGWHNNHHRCMVSARHGFRWWEIDLNYYALRVLQACGVVWDLRMPTRAIYAGQSLVRRSRRVVPATPPLPVSTEASAVAPCVVAPVAMPPAAPAIASDGER
jgi:stearoyl-CoA desaturase (delta-9 desaturase)